MIFADCPRCGFTHEDMDGFGVLACSECGYCSHPDITGGICVICGAERRYEDARCVKTGLHPVSCMECLQCVTHHPDSPLAATEARG